MGGESPFVWIFAGIVVSAIGGALWQIPEDVPSWVAAAVLALGGIILQVCAIAAGVTWGMARHARQTAKYGTGA